MGWGGPFTLNDGRKVGYNVRATCDFGGCKTLIDHGLAYLCGRMHGEDEDGCTYYFCATHHAPELHDCPNLADEDDE